MKIVCVVVVSVCFFRAILRFSFIRDIQVHDVERTFLHYKSTNNI